MDHIALLGYVDPGSGTLLLQAIIAGVAGCLVFAKGLFAGLAGMLRFRTGNKDVTD